MLAKAITLQLGSCVQVGACKDFDPAIYRRQLELYATSKASAAHNAYRGAGDILHHPGASRPVSHQPIAPKALGVDVDDAEKQDASPPMSVEPSQTGASIDIA